MHRLKEAFLLSVALSLIALLYSQGQALQAQKDVLVASVQTSPNEAFWASLKALPIQRFETKGAYIRKDASLSAGARGLETTLYHASETMLQALNRKMLAGRPILDEDVRFQRSYMVLDQSLALKLFGGYDCLGKKVEMDGRAYQVIGICAPDVSSLGQLTAVMDSGAAFVPLRFSDSKETCVIYARTRPGGARLYAGALKSAFEDENIQVEDIDIQARLGLQWIAWGLFICYIFVLSRLVKKECSALLSHTGAARLKPALVLLCLGALGIALFTVFDFSLAIDTGILPSDIANPQLWRESIARYLISKNTAPGVPCPIHALVIRAPSQIGGMGLMLLLSLRGLFKPSNLN